MKSIQGPLYFLSTYKISNFSLKTFSKLWCDLREKSTWWCSIYPVLHQKPACAANGLPSTSLCLYFQQWFVRSEASCESCSGFWKQELGFLQRHHSLFRFRTSCGFPFFSIFHSNISASLGSFIIVPCIYQSFSAAVGELMRCSGPRLRPGLECVFTCCLAQLRGMCEGVWRQSGRVCDLKRLNGGGCALLPFHPHSPFPDKRKPLTGSDGAKLVKIALPAPLSSLRVGLSLFSMRLSLSTTTQPQCLEVGLAKSYCFSSKAKDFNWKRAPEWKLTSLFRPLFWENTETHQGKENEMWSWWKKWVMFLKQMEEEVWHLASLCFTYNGPGFFFFF